LFIYCVDFLMFDYLQQFNKLAPDLKAKISAPAIMSVVTELENKYQVDLAMTVMKVMIKSLALNNLPAYFISELALSAAQSDSLTQELKSRVFFVVADYLGLSSEVRALSLDQDIKVLIKEAELTLSSEVLIVRLKNILSTYIRGIRSKIDTRAALAKDAKIGGLNLSEGEINRLLKVCDTHKFAPISSSSLTKIASLPAPSNSLAKLLAATTPLISPAAEYDLKVALASGQTKPLPAAVDKAGAPFKSVNKLDLAHELASPAPILDLPVGLPKSAVASVVAAKIKPSLASIPLPPAPAAKTSVNQSKPVVSDATAKAPAVNLSNIQAVKPKIAIPTPVVAKPKVSDIPPPVSKRPVSAPVSGRPQMHDIKPMPKIIGPLEELQFLDLVNFRRLGQNPTEITDKVLAKVKLLERDGYDKMVLGVRAWRQSPINRFYLRLCQEAIAKGVPLRTYLTDEKQAGRDCLSWDEIGAIVKLNGQLVY
jgi:hypothetical protein